LHLAFGESREKWNFPKDLGTFLGVWNLLAISSHRSIETVSPAWIQAHGHAQVFGWIGSFILGIGFYSIPKLRRLEPFALEGHGFVG
jgi:uncharacterized protein involved in response to NO